MELQSDTCFGSGKSSSGVVDVEAKVDKDGFPYIGGSVFKGLLREEIEQLLYLKGGACAVDGIADPVGFLFGEEGASDPSMLDIGNGYPENFSDLKESLEAWQHSDDSSVDIFAGPSQVAAFYTRIKRQTSLENRVAKKGAQWGTRVVKRGICSFVFPVRLDVSNKEDYPGFEKLIEDAVKCIRHGGVSRNRGLGNLSCSCEWLSDASPPLSPTLPDKTSEVLYEIELLADLKTDDDFIAGSKLLGATVDAFFSKYDKIDRSNAQDDPLFINLFLAGKLRFGNAYPLLTEGKTIPAPKNLRFDKNDAGEDGRLTNLLVVDADAPDKQYSAYARDFCVVKDRRVSGADIRHVENPHHKNANDRAVGAARSDDGGEFFTYEAVEKGTRFQGALSGPLELIAEAIVLLSSRPLRMGRSRGKEYGDCQITFSTALGGESPGVAENGKEAVFVFASDCILLDQLGMPSVSTEVLKQEIARVAGVGADKISIDDKRSFRTVGTHGGFNGQWRMPRAKVPCLAMGSVITLKFSGLDEKAIDSAIATLCSRPLGLYSEHGHGRLDMLPESLAKTLGNHKGSSLIDACEKEPEFKGLLPSLVENWVLVELAENIRSFEYGLHTSTLTYKYVSEVYRHLSASTTSKSTVGILLNALETSKSYDDWMEVFTRRVDREKKRFGEEKAADKGVYTVLLQRLQTIGGSTGFAEVAKALVKDKFELNFHGSNRIAKAWQNSIDETKRFELHKLLLILICRRVKDERRSGRGEAQ
jgi:CRISPR-associated protein Csx10